MTCGVIVVGVYECCEMHVLWINLNILLGCVCAQYNMILNLEYICTHLTLIIWLLVFVAYTVYETFVEDLHALLRYHLDNCWWVVYMDATSRPYNGITIVDILFYTLYYQFTNFLCAESSGNTCLQEISQEACSC